MNFSKWLANLSGKVNNGLSWVFEKHGAFTYRYPLVILIGSIVLLLSLAYGFTLYEEESDETELWVPQGVTALDHRDIVEEYFNMNTVTEYVYVVGKNDGDNIITAAAFNELMAYEQSVWNNIVADESKFNDVCAKSDTSSSSNESACLKSGYPLDFYIKADGTFETADNTIVSRINSAKGTADFYTPGGSTYISIDDMFSGTTPSNVVINQDGTNNIQAAEALKWIFYLKKDDISFSLQEDYEKKYDDHAREFNKNSQYIRVYPIMRTSIGRELADAFDRDLRLIFIGVALIVVYSLYVVAQLNTYESRMFVGIFGTLSIIIAYIEAVSLGALIGIVGNSVVGVLPFLLMGIGVDDMYVLLNDLARAPKEASGEEKMKYMMKHAGVSITITSITNFSAFAIGSVTTIPGIRSFCWYAAIGMIFDYVNQLTFFLSIVAFDIRRSMKSRGDCCGLIFCKPEQCCNGKFILDENGEQQPPTSFKFMTEYYGKYLMKTPVKIAVLAIFLGLLGFNIYGVTQLDRNFDYEWFANEDFEIYDSLVVRDRYFSGSGIEVGFYTLDADFSSASVQASLESLEGMIDTCDGCDEEWIVEGSADSWYAQFKNWVSRGNCNVSNTQVTLSGGYVPSSYFYQCLKAWEESEGFLYESNLAWNSNDSALEGASITAVMIKIDGSARKVQAMYDTRDIGDDGPGNTFPYNNEYPWGEHNAVFGRETTIQLTSALGFVFLIVLLTNADFIAALLVMCMVGFTVIGQLSNLYFWDEHLNIVTIINTVMAVGISVDYSAHLVHTFKATKDDSKNTRVITTLGIIGTGIFNGGFSTFLAILPLALSETYIFQTFFKCWFSLIVYGLGHALILLPVLLSFIGPPPFPEEDSKKSSKTGQEPDMRENNSLGQRDDV